MANAFPPIIVISLGRVAERRAAMQRELAGFDFEFFEAVDGNALDESVYRHRMQTEWWKLMRGRQLSPGEIGCFLSHYGVWQRIVETGTPFALILEDDARLEDTFADRVEELMGMTVREIQAHLHELYRVEVSPDLISRVTDAVLEEVREWQNRPLDGVYPVVFFDALRVKIRDEGLVRNKVVYRAETAEAAAVRLDAFDAGWGERYPAIAPAWQRAWEHVVPMFAFPPQIRKMIYTTNALESLHRSLRKIIKTRGSFPSDEAATKLLYLALRSAGMRWRRPIEWTAAMGRFAILFEDRFPASAR